MPTFSNIDGEESATVTFTVSAIALTRNSSAELQEILCIGDPDISTNVARVTSVPPDSTMAGLGVRIISGPSTASAFTVRPIFPSTATDNPVSMPATQTINVRSSAANALVSVYQSSAAELRVSVYQSSVADLKASVAQNSTVWQSNVRLQPGQAFTCNQVTINSTAVQIAAANANRTRLVVIQHGSIPLYLGASTVTSTSGILLSSASGYPMVFRHDDAIYGISSASTGVVSFYEETI